MRRNLSPKPPAASESLAQTHTWRPLQLLFPYLWQYRGRMLLAISCLIGAKLANVGVPLVFKEMIDGMSPNQQLLALPVGLLLLYGTLRFSTSLFT